MQIDIHGTILTKEKIYSVTRLPFDDELFMKSFNEAVKQRLVADVQVAQSLSGGKDSGLVNISLLQNKHQLPRFTIQNTKHEIDESEFVEQIAKQYDVPLNIVVLKNNLINDELIKTLVYQEVPSWDLGFIGFHSYYSQVSKSAKVIIEGHGPDELHGGYQDYLLVKIIQAYTF